ncbi:MAG: Tex-like N-terminal domain-containing protein, partial [Anaerotignaceae bacterium]
MEKNTLILAKEFNLKTTHVENIVTLIDEGNTIPFIARYRKEMTGEVDDQLLRLLADRLTYLRNLDKRREEILNSIEAQDKLTDELTKQINDAETLATLEDLYRPFKQKRRTKATVAREKGLEPLADVLFKQLTKSGTIEDLAKPFIDAEKGVETVEDALTGANDIIAENISDNAEIRDKLKKHFLKNGIISSKSTTEEDTVYRLYYDFQSPVSKTPSHRVLAINRGEKENILKVGISCEEESCLKIIYNVVVKDKSISTDFVKTAAVDSYNRLIFPSIEREIRNYLTDLANEQAIKMFSVNLEPLLMQPPIKNKVTLGFDPGYRTGCKIAVVDETGMVLATGVVYPTPPANKKEEATKKLTDLIK